MYYHAVDDAPSIQQLLYEVGQDCPDKWRVIGVQLNIPEYELEAIAHMNLLPIGCHHKVFDFWRKAITSPYSWATIIDVLKSPAVNERSLAIKVEQWLSQKGKPSHAPCIYMYNH